MRLTLSKLRRRVRRELDAQTAMLVVGLGLLAAGGAMCWRPAGLLIPGAVLTWIALPTRVPFVARVQQAAPQPVPHGKGA